MNFMGLLQKSALWVIILVFVGIAGYEMYGRFKEYQAVRKAKHKKLLRELEKEDKA